MTNMESLARAFDQPIDSPEHQALATSVWLASDLVTVRYWLGRLIECNLFRESDEAVAEAMRSHLIASGCEKGACLVADAQSWPPLALLFRHELETRTGLAPTANRRLIAAIQAVMTDLDRTNAELAAIANTTVKQIARMPEVFVLRKLWNNRAR